MRVLLTGGNGLLGRAIRRVAADFPATTLDAPGRAQLDLLSQDSVSAWFRDRSYDLVIHAAARVGGIRANVDYPTEFIAENLVMNTLLIEASRKAGIRRLIFIGSSCMYPKDLGHALRETDILTAPLEPTNEGYALSKLAGAHHCASVSRQYGLAYRTVIPCNLYGPDDHFEPLGSHLVAATLLKTHEARESRADTITIWGDGTARREFLYVDDLARFLLDAAPRLAELPQLLNLGAGDDRTVNEYYRAAASTVGYTGGFSHDLSAPVGMMRKLMDSSVAQGFGWKPTTTLSDGLRLAYAGMLRH